MTHEERTKLSFALRDVPTEDLQQGEREMYGRWSRIKAELEDAGQIWCCYYTEVDRRKTEAEVNAKVEALVKERMVAAR